MAKIDDIETMLKALINNISTFKQEVFKRFDEIDKRFENLETRLNKRIDGVENRLDNIGKQLAYLEDDAPTREEFDGLEKRVGKLERKPSPAL